MRKKILTLLLMTFFGCPLVGHAATPVVVDNAKNAITKTTKTYSEAGNDLLRKGVQARNLEQVQQAFLLNANPNLCGSGSSSSPFFQAITYNLTEIVQCFIDNNADVNFRLYYPASGEFTPLWIAVINRQPEMVEMLIGANADIDKPLINGDTVLFWTVRENNPIDLRMTKYLIEEHTNVNKVDVYGETPLMVAAQKGNFEAVQLLIESKADPNKINKNGQTAYDLAIKNNRKEIADYLRLLTVKR